MSLPPPSAYNPELAADRLQIVASWLLEEFYATEDDLSRPTDNNYTRGCTTFGRQRNRILKEASSGKHAWMGLANSSNDIVFTIGGVPCRFSNDDPANPSKDAVLTANYHQMEFLEFASKGEPGRFCFVIDRGDGETSEPQVELLGFAPGGEVVCRWIADKVRVFRLGGEQSLPPAVPVGKPKVSPKQRDKSDAATETVR